MINRSDFKSAHIAPHTIKIASMFSIMSRLKPSAKCDLLTKLKINADDLLRKKETEYSSLNLQDLSDLDLLEVMSNYPNLIERPIVVFGEQAIFGRPPENISKLIAHV